MAIGGALSVGLVGLKSFTVQVQAFVSPGLPCFSIIGLPDTSLSEARERVRSACQACGFSWPAVRVTVNLSPASMPKRGSSHDLAIAASVLSAAGVISRGCLERTVVLGELNLDGSVLPVTGVLPIVLHAREHGIARVVVPSGNVDEARLVEGPDVVGVCHVGEFIELMGGTADYVVSGGLLSYGVHDGSDVSLSVPVVGDMADVVGQDHAKRALEIAAVGGHHVLMVGPAGSGKTMLASRLPGIMGPLDEGEQLEVASIRSLCGVLPQYGISDIPPFEAPHHTASTAALVGGGAGLAQPGAITRAHRGLLFMDEAPEFSARVLQTLREPLESGFVALSRFRGTTYYPACFQLVMAANPCPCGQAYGTGERCTCRERDRVRYFSRLSGPILDRIDIQIDVPAVSGYSTSTNVCETSHDIRQRVVTARSAAKERFVHQGWTCNAQASGTWLRDNTSRKALTVIDKALADQRISLRGADRALRLAWTLADINGRVSPGRDETLHGLALRTRVT